MNFQIIKVLLLICILGFFLNIFSNENNFANITTKRASWAVVSNVLIPGLGFKMIEKEKQAFSYFSCEVFFNFIGFYYLEKLTNYYEASKVYARFYAHIKGEGMDDWYWEIIGNEHYQNYRQYNNMVSMNGEYDKKITNPDLFWSWLSSTYQDKYNDMRYNEAKEKGLFKRACITFFSCAMLNRIVSTTDVIMAIKKNRRLFRKTSLEFKPQIDLISKNSGVNLCLTFGY